MSSMANTVEPWATNSFNASGAASELESPTTTCSGFKRERSARPSTLASNSGKHLAEHHLQDAAIAVVLGFRRPIDADRGREQELVPVFAPDLNRDLVTRDDPSGEAENRECLATGEPERCRRL